MVDQPALFEMPVSAYVSLKVCLVCGGRIHQRYRGPDVPLYTYAMQRQDWLKIGMSRDPEIRARDLRAPNRQQYIRCPEGMDRRAPLEIVKVWLGDLEHALHMRWRECHAAGEWFHLTKELTAWLKT